MKIKRILWEVWIAVMLQIPVSAGSASISTSFDLPNVESNKVTLLSCPSPGWKPGQRCSQVSVIKWDLGSRWPDNRLQRKVKLDLSDRQSSGLKNTRDLPLSGYQKAEVQFYAPDGISDHIDLGVLGDNIAAVQVTGYFAMIGRDHNRLGPGYRLSIEKATTTGNWLFPGTYPNGGISFTFHSDRVYKLALVASSGNGTVTLDSTIEEWAPGKGWNKVASIKHIDDGRTCETDTTGKSEGNCQIVTGRTSFFGAIFQNNSVYFDQFSAHW